MSLLTLRYRWAGLACVGLLLPLAGIAQEQCCSKEAGSKGGEVCCNSQSAGEVISEADGGHGAHEARGQRGGMAVMPNAHALIAAHESIVRTFEEIPGGIRSTTTTEDAEVLPILRQHVREMYAHLDAGGHVRRGDPLFRELAAVQDFINVEVKDINNGIEVVSTSENEQVARLIRMHAAKVSDFVARGPAAMREHTPLPADYVRPEGVAAPAKGSCCQK